MSETAERLWNALHGGETVSNVKVKQEAPERVWIDMSSSGNMEVVDEAAISADDVEYVRADLLATVRKEEREAVWKEAIEIAKRHWVLVPAESENRPLDVQRWQGYNLATKEIRAALEASANSEKQVNEDDHRCYNKGGAL